MSFPDENDRDSQVWRGRLLLLLGGLFIFRLIYLAVVPVDLIHDEAYYWDWSRQLDWGYYSKPPGIAWLIALSTRLGDSTPFFVRLPAAVLSTAGLYFAYLLGSRLYGPKAGFFAALLSAATPGNAALGLVMTIDAPLLFCWAAALYFLWRMLEDGPDRASWTLLTACAIGGGLLCKQTMLAFPVLTASFVLLRAEDRRELAKPSFWLCEAGGLLFLLPVIWWNSQHGWITAMHTQQHFSPESVTLAKRFARCGEFLAAQLGILSPVTWLLIVIVLVTAPRVFRHFSKAERFLVWFSGVPLAGVLVLSLNQRVEPNWPAPFYAAAIVLVAGAATHGLHFALKPPALRRAVSVGIVSVAVTYCLPFLIDGFGLKGSPVDAVARMWGWEELGLKISNRLAQLPRPDQTLILAEDRATASELAFYLPNQPEVHLWNSSKAIHSQYDVWGLPHDKQGWDVFIVSRRESLDPELAAAFRRVEPLGPETVEIGSNRRHAYHLWRGIGLTQWPGTPHPDVALSPSEHSRR